MKGERGGKAGPGMKKGPWSAEEDRLLIEYVSENGEGNWNSVQKRTGLERCGKSCRLRWANHLRPDLKKGQFTAEEEEMIVRMHIEMGNKWARMASFLLGRTDNEIKNYWNTRIKRRQRAGLPLYPPEMFQRPQQQDELVPMFAGGSVGGEALPAQPRAVTIGYGLMPMLPPPPPPPPPPPVMPSWFLQAELPSSQFFGEVSGGGGGLMDVLMQELDGGGGVQQCGDMLLLEEQTTAQERDDNGVENDKGPMELSTMATLKDSRRSIENSIGEGIEVKNGVSSHDDITTLFDMIISNPPSVPTVIPYWYDDDNVGNMSNGEQA